VIVVPGLFKFDSPDLAVRRDHNERAQLLTQLEYGGITVSSTPTFADLLRDLPRGSSFLHESNWVQFFFSRGHDGGKFLSRFTKMADTRFIGKPVVSPQGLLVERLRAVDHRIWGKKLRAVMIMIRSDELRSPITNSEIREAHRRFQGADRDRYMRDMFRLTLLLGGLVVERKGEHVPPFPFTHFQEDAEEAIRQAKYVGSITPAVIEYEAMHMGAPSTDIFSLEQMQYFNVRTEYVRNVAIRARDAAWEPKEDDLFELGRNIRDSWLTNFPVLTTHLRPRNLKWGPIRFGDHDEYTFAHTLRRVIHRDAAALAQYFETGRERLNGLDL
jgi:hypothetical protein